MRSGCPETRGFTTQMRSEQRAEAGMCRECVSKDDLIRRLKALVVRLEAELARVDRRAYLREWKRR